VCLSICLSIRLSITLYFYFWSFVQFRELVEAETLQNKSCLNAKAILTEAFND